MVKDRKFSRKKVCFREEKNLNNSWNKFIYKIWSPFYDRFFNSEMFVKARKKVFKDVQLEAGSKILFVGVGTGADLPFFLNKGYEIVAIDYSIDMLRIAKAKYGHCSVEFLEMDAQKLEFKDESFDFIVANLILSVVPDPHKTLNEMLRVLKNEGEFLVLDKFVPQEKKLTVAQRFIRPFIKLLGTDIGLDFYHVLQSAENKCLVYQDEKVMMNGFYRKIMGMRKDVQREGDVSI